MTFEENAEEIASDVASLGFDLPELIEAKKLAVDYVRVERSEIEETGEYDLEGLFVRLDYAIRTRGRQARRPRHHRVAVCGPQGRRHPPRGTAPAVPVAEGQGRHRRDHGRARRGPADQAGARGVRLGCRDPARPPRPRSGLDAPPARGQVPRLPPRDERVSVPHRRARASACCRCPRWPWRTRRRSIAFPPASRVSTRCSAARGTTAAAPCSCPARAGTGKTSLAAHFLDAACRRGERCLCFLFEESPQQLLRNMRSIGIDLEPWVARRTAAVPRRPAVALRARDPPRDDAPGRGGLQADRVGHRPGDEPDDGRHLRRRAGDAHAHDRSSEDREHHGRC